MDDKHSRTQSSDVSSLFAALCLRSVLPALGIAALLLLAAAAIVYAQPDPGRAALPAALAALYVSALLCGFFAARNVRQSPLATGAAAGGLFLLLITLLSLLPRVDGGTGFSPLLSAAAHAAVLLAALCGALLGGRRKTTSAARKKRRR